METSAALFAAYILRQEAVKKRQEIKATQIADIEHLINNVAKP